MKSLIIVAIAALTLFSCCADAQCYNCTFLEMGEEFTIGPEGCKEPFDSAGIQTVPCSGKCTYIHMDMAADDVLPQMTTHMRACFNEIYEGPCMDLDGLAIIDGMTYTQRCCTGALCNV